MAARTYSFLVAERVSMGIAWKVIKTASKVNTSWYAKVKHFENLNRADNYSSPVPNIDAIRKAEDRIFDRSVRELPGIDLNCSEQLRYLESIERFYQELPFPEQETSATRYYFDNKWFPYSDGIFYFGMLRLARPKKVIEVGVGFTSALFLDTNERFFGGSTECVFIDPSTGRLESLLRDQDRDTARIIPHPVQDVDDREFDDLAANDILFIDSSHVSKVGSDVNRLLFEILPRLRSGVFVHIHDIFFPFENSKSGVYRGGTANETYVVRAFLQYNTEFRIVAWNDYLELAESARIRTTMPLCKRNSGSLWLQRR